MVAATLLRTPELSLRWIPVWRRNLLVWRKLAIASVLGNIADPLLYMLALGYGIGAFVPEIGGMKYIAFIGTGMVCQSAMFTSSFEAMYSAFSRMHVQRTWEAIINAPVSLDDVVFAEWVWAATKSVMSVMAILVVILLLGFGHSWLAVWVIPLGFVTGLTFAGFGLLMNSLARNYDFFTYSLTLFQTPMLLLSGVFFPVDPCSSRSIRCRPRCKPAPWCCRCRTRSTSPARCSRARCRTVPRCTSRCFWPMRS